MSIHLILNPHKSHEAAKFSKIREISLDGVPCHLFQVVAKELAPDLTLLFNSSLASGQVPQLWKHTLVQPIFKKEDRSQAAHS